MAMQLLQNRGRVAALAGALVIHLLLIAAIMWLSPGAPSAPLAGSPMVSVNVTEPPPPPPPPAPQTRPRPKPAPPAAAAPPSRGVTARPAPRQIVNSLAKPIPVPPSVDSGSGPAAGQGNRVGTGAGLGGAGQGSGAGAGGDGAGQGPPTPPVHISGALTNADYRAAGAPRGAAGTVEVAFRVRRDGSVYGCEVTGSSGYAEFDFATCRLIEARFRFRPALDGAGSPIEWKIRTEYTWSPR